MEKLWQHTRLQIEVLRKKGYTVVEKWECDFRREISLDARLHQFYKHYKVHEALQPRDAFFGGRTNAIRLFFQSTGRDKIRYVDYTSLYPHVCKYAKFPMGHSVI